MRRRDDKTRRKHSTSDASGPAHVEHLLRTLDLPTAGVSEWSERFWIADHAGKPVGVVGIEQYGDAALLRSVAVDGTWRDSGLGQALVEAA